MSTQYRKADCQSTKNVGGDKPVDQQSGPSGTSLGFKVQAEHAYLGHFKQEKFLREGHNSIFDEVLDSLKGNRNPADNPFDSDGGGSSSRPRWKPTTVGTTAAGNVVSRMGARTRTQAADVARRDVARRAIKSGGAGAAAVAAERPVLAARMAARQAGATGAERRAAVQTARGDVNSARSERRAARRPAGGSYR